MVRAADPAPQLVQLREAELVGAIDDHGVRVRVVDAGLDDGRAEEHVRPLRGEVAHHALELALRHLPVGDGDARLGQEALQALAHALDRVDLVMQEVDLAAALEFPHRRFADESLGEGGNERLDGQSLLRRGGDDREVADAFERHGERARDRRRGERQHIDLGAQLLQRLFLPHAEAVLLVDDHQADARQLDLAPEQFVRADDNVELALRQLVQNLVRLLRCLEARELGDAHRPLGEAIVERVEVLLGEERRRAEHHDLLAVRDRDKRGAQRHLGLAEADIAAHQAIHRLAGRHIGGHRLDGRRLVGRLLEVETRGEGLDIVRPDAEGMAMARGALGV